LLHPSARRAHRPAAALRPHLHVPLQGHGHLLVAGRQRPHLSRLRLDVPGSASREPEGGRPGLLLQREGRHHRGWGAAGSPEHAVLLTRNLWVVAKLEIINQDDLPVLHHYPVPGCEATNLRGATFAHHGDYSLWLCRAELAAGAELSIGSDHGDYGIYVAE